MSRARNRAVNALANESAPADSLAGAHDGGSKGQTSVNGEYYTLAKRATAPDEITDAKLRRLAMYQDANKKLCTVPLTEDLTPQSAIEYRRRQWRFVRVLVVLPHETVEQALDRAILEEVARTDALVDEILSQPQFAEARATRAAAGASVA